MFNKQKVEVIVKVFISPERIMIKGRNGKRGIESVIDSVLGQTKQCPSVKIIFTAGALENQDSASIPMLESEV